MPYPKITIRGLQALVAVYEERSFSRAAERENATQSGMSTQVKNLETLLGTELLSRGKGEMALSPAGQIVYENGRKILRSLYELEQRVQDLRGAVTGTIRFGIIPGLTRAVLPRVMRSYREDYPDVEISVLEEYSYSLMRRVNEGDLDCAVVPAGDLLKGLTSIHVASDIEVLVAQAEFQKARPHLSPVRPEDLTGLNLIMPSPQNVRRQWLDRYFDAHGVRLGSVLEMDAMLATLEFVATSDWCAVLPSVLCHPDLDGHTRKLHPLSDPPLQTDYVVVQKAERALNQAATLLVERVRDGAKEVRREWDAEAMAAEGNR